MLAYQRVELVTTVYINHHLDYFLVAGNDGMNDP